MGFDLLRENLQKALKEAGFDEPTEIQRIAIEKIKQGKSVIISAPTGYGKTFAAFLPCLDQIDTSKGGIQLLYITPLRALNRDIFKNIINISNKIGVEIDIRHADTTPTERKNQVSMPPHCLITTPETLQSLFLSKGMRENLRNLKFLIVDEIQSLMESKRGTQLSVAIERLRMFSPDFKTIGLSATIADSEETRRFLKCDEVVNTTDIKEYDISVTYPSIEKEDEKLASENDISDVVADSLNKIISLINESKSTLIFTNTRETAELLGSRLHGLLENKKMEVHHSSLSKEVRTDIENRFKKGEIDVVIATSSMELGIDIGNVDLVIQYMSPRQVVKLVQRVGRSNHRQSGVAKGAIITTDIDDFLESKAIDLCRLENKLEKIPLPKNSLDVLAHQIVGLVIDGVGEEKEIYKIIRRSYAFEDLKEEEFQKTVDFLISHYFIRKYGNNVVRTKRGLLFYIQNVSMIPDQKTYIVIDSQLNKKIGTLDENFVAEHSEEGEIFVMKGETWKIVKIEGRKILVIRTENLLGAIPAWEGELMPVYRFVAEKAAELREKYRDEFSVLGEQGRNFLIPNKDLILLEKIRDFVIIHSTFGNKINEALANVIGFVLAEKKGESIPTKVDPYRIILKTDAPLKEIKDILETLEDIETKLRENLRQTSLYTHRFLNELKRFGVMNKEADYSKAYLRSVMEMYKNTIVEEELFNEIFGSKLDVDGAEDILKRIKRKEVKLAINDGDASPLAYEGIESSYGGSLIKPTEAKKVLRSLVLERLENTKLYMQCLNCGHEIKEISVQNTGGIKCPKCKARYIAFFKLKYKDIYPKIIKKFLKKRKLTSEEKAIMEGIKQSAALYLAYDKSACLVGAAYGIGPTTASRILSSYSFNKDELLDKIIEAEKNYIETREYWS